MQRSRSATHRHPPEPTITVTCNNRPYPTFYTNCIPDIQFISHEAENLFIPLSINVSKSTKSCSVSGTLNFERYSASILPAERASTMNREYGFYTVSVYVIGVVKIFCLLHAKYAYGPCTVLGNLLWLLSICYLTFTCALPLYWTQADAVMLVHKK